MSSAVFVVQDLVREVKTSINTANDVLAASDIRLKKVTLDLKTTSTIDMNGNIEWAKLVTVGMKVSKQAVETVTVTFVPPRPPSQKRELGGTPMGDALTQQIGMMLVAVRESVESTPRLDFDQAEITVNIAVEKDGSIKIIFGAEVTEENAQTVKLEFEPSVALGQLDHPLLETEHARTYERGGDGHMFG